MGLSLICEIDLLEGVTHETVVAMVDRFDERDGGMSVLDAKVRLQAHDERRLRTEQFTGGEIVSIFGDALIELRDAKLRAKPAVIEAVSIFGDAEVQVPREWDVRLKTLNIFGDTTDRRPDPDESRPSDGQPHLVVTGVSLFGDIDIRA